MASKNNHESVLAGYMSRGELAKEIKRHPRTLDRWDSLKIGPPRTVLGRRILYRREAVAAWLRAQEEAPQNTRAA